MASLITVFLQYKQLRANKDSFLHFELILVWHFVRMQRVLYFTWYSGIAN